MFREYKVKHIAIEPGKNSYKHLTPCPVVGHNVKVGGDFCDEYCMFLDHYTNPDLDFQDKEYIPIKEIEPGVIRGCVSCQYNEDPFGIITIEKLKTLCYKYLDYCDKLMGYYKVDKRKLKTQIKKAKRIGKLILLYSKHISLEKKYY